MLAVGEGHTMCGPQTWMGSAPDLEDDSSCPGLSFPIYLQVLFRPLQTDHGNHTSWLLSFPLPSFVHSSLKYLLSAHCMPGASIPGLSPPCRLPLMLENPPLPPQSVVQFWKEVWVLGAPWWQDVGRRESGHPVLPTAAKGPVLGPWKTPTFPTQACLLRAHPYASTRPRL